jgi:predicted nucleic acid-binding protein
MTSQAQTPVVVDTNVVSYIYRNDPIASQYIQRMKNHRAVISFQTYEELLFGVLVKSWGQRRRDELFQYVDTTYEMVGYDRELVNICARLRADSRSRGMELSIADAWIAATAIWLDCPLLAHDRDFGNPAELQVVRFD